MNAIVENLLAKSDVLIVFIGMALLLWRQQAAMSAVVKILADKLGAMPSIPDTHAIVPVGPAHTTTTTTTTTPAHADSPAVDQGLIDFIKKAEGFRSTPYWDYKQWTVGYGTKASGPTDTVTEAEALKRLTAEINAADKLVNDFMPNLPKGQRQALVDLTYNAGSGWQQGSLGAAVKAQKIDTIKADILQYNHAGGQVNAGLTARREAEVSWFDNPL